MWCQSKAGYPTGDNLFSVASPLRRGVEYALIGTTSDASSAKQPDLFRSRGHQGSNLLDPRVRPPQSSTSQEPNVKGHVPWDAGDGRSSVGRICIAVHGLWYDASSKTSSEACMVAKILHELCTTCEAGQFCCEAHQSRRVLSALIRFNQDWKSGMRRIIFPRTEVRMGQRGRRWLR